MWRHNFGRPHVLMVTIPKVEMQDKQLDISVGGVGEQLLRMKRENMTPSRTTSVFYIRGIFEIVFGRRLH